MKQKYVYKMISSYVLSPVTHGFQWIDPELSFVFSSFFIFHYNLWPTNLIVDHILLMVLQIIFNLMDILTAWHPRTTSNWYEALKNRWCVKISCIILSDIILSTMFKCLHEMVQFMSFIKSRFSYDFFCDFFFCGFFLFLIFSIHFSLH